jgi:hypothetical protein
MVTLLRMGASINFNRKLRVAIAEKFQVPNLLFKGMNICYSLIIFETVSEVDTIAILHAAIRGR